MTAKGDTENQGPKQAPRTNDPPGPDGSPEVQALKRDILQLKNDLKQLIQSVEADGGEKAQEVKMRLAAATKDFKDQTEEKLQDLYDAAHDRGVEAMEDTRRRVSQNPLTSILLAFLGGLVFGKLFMRK